MRLRVLLGDAREVLGRMEADSVDAVVTDPPAGISFMGKEWDDFSEGRRGQGVKEGYDDKPAGYYFRNKVRTTSVRTSTNEREAFIAFLSEVFSEVRRVLRPGGHALIWSLPRTSHWTGMALEEAGFEVRDRLAHIFGSGFPKSLDVSKAIDKAVGAEREVIGRYLGASNIGAKSDGKLGYAPGTDYPVVDRTVEVTTPATAERLRWQGCGTALKPAVEDWWLVRKPLREPSVAANVLRWGTGGLNVDGCRVSGVYKWRASDSKQFSGSSFSDGSFGDGPHPSGRWPSNLVLSHVPPDANGEGGCRRVGTRRVRGSAPASGPTLTGPSISNSRGRFKGVAETASHADPDGTELVEAFECVAGGTITVLSFSGRIGDVSPLDEPEYLLDRLQALIQEARGCSTTHSSLSPDAFAFYHSGGKRSAGSSVGPTDAVANALGLIGLPDFRVGCPSCRRSCDALVRSVLEAARVGALPLVDALARVHTDLSQPAHSLSYPDRDPRSNSDDSHLRDEQLDTHENRISGALQDGESLEPASHNAGTGLWAQPSSGQHDSTDENSTSAGDSHRTSLCNVCRSAAVRLLATLAADLSWRFYLPGLIIQRHENVINLPSCPVAELDRQSGNLKSPRSYERSTQDGGSSPLPMARVGSKPSVDPFVQSYGDEGGASRFFPTFQPDQDDFVPWRYVAKADTVERNAGCEGLLRRKSGVMQDDAYLWEYDGKGNKINLNTKQANNHPTVKSLALCRWLITLITPPDGTVLDCFLGSGSVGCAAAQLGFNFIGIESDPEYHAIAVARIRHWAGLFGQVETEEATE